MILAQMAKALSLSKGMFNNPASRELKGICGAFEAILRNSNGQMIIKRAS